MKITAKQLELNRLNALTAHNQSIAIVQASASIRADVLDQARASFILGANLGEGSAKTLTTSEILERLEALNFKVEKASKFKTVFANLKSSNLDNSLKSLATIEETLLEAILETRQVDKYFAIVARAKAQDANTTLDALTHVDLLATIDKASLYYYNARYNEHHAITQFKPILTAYNMMHAYNKNVNALIAKRKSKKQAAALIEA